ncbi:hypothetical protein Tco_1263013 [Tanacetum coccineum]
MHISYSICSKLKTLVGVAFTGVEWERLCQDVMFSATKVLIISSNESVDLFVGKVIDGFVPEPVKKFNSARGESSNAGACSEKSFIAEFSLCIDTKGYLCLVLQYYSFNNGLVDTGVSVQNVLISFGMILYQGSGSGVWE